MINYKIIINNEFDFAKTIVQNIEDNNWLSTYNISSFKEDSIVTRILIELNRAKNSNITVGLPKYYPCYKGCIHCTKKHRKNMLKIVEIRDKYTNINWNFVRNNHSKLFLNKNIAILGGRNLSDSDYNDISIVHMATIENKRLFAELKQLWDQVSINPIDIGINGPPLFLHPYRGEVLMDSTSIPNEFKLSVIENDPNSTAAIYWKKMAKQHPNQ